jgi:hypothetical protein
MDGGRCGIPERIYGASSGIHSIGGDVADDRDERVAHG